LNSGVASLIIEAIAVFFWLRGLYRKCKADVVVGWVLLMIAMGLCLKASWGSLSSLSLPLVIFGAANLTASFVDRQKTSIISADHLRLLGIVCLILAFCSSIML